MNTIQITCQHVTATRGIMIDPKKLTRAILDGKKRAKEDGLKPEFISIAGKTIPIKPLLAILNLSEDIVSFTPGIKESWWEYRVIGFRRGNKTIPSRLYTDRRIVKPTQGIYMRSGNSTSFFKASPVKDDPVLIL